MPVRNLDDRNGTISNRGNAVVQLHSLVHLKKVNAGNEMRVTMPSCQGRYGMVTKVSGAITASAVATTFGYHRFCLGPSRVTWLILAGCGSKTNGVKNDVF